MFRVDNRGSPVTVDEFIMLCLPRSSVNESGCEARIQVSQDTGGSWKMLFYFIFLLLQPTCLFEHSGFMCT